MEDFMIITENECVIEITNKNPTPCVIIMPRNMSDHSRAESIYSSSSIDMLKLFRKNEIETYLYDDNYSLQENRANDWFGPVLFISYMTISQNPNILNIALNVISNYVYDFFKGVLAPGKVRLSIIRENSDGSKTEIKYEGDSDGIKELEKIVKATK
jgi:hypothetical protein